MCHCVNAWWIERGCLCCWDRQQYSIDRHTILSRTYVLVHTYVPMFVLLYVTSSCIRSNVNEHVDFMQSIVINESFHTQFTVINQEQHSWNWFPFHCAKHAFNSCSYISRVRCWSIPPKVDITKLPSSGFYLDTEMESGIILFAE